MITRTKLFTLASAIWFSALSSSAATINQLVTFGDSLSDNGNAAFALGGTVAGNYAPNAFTDGPNTTPATSGPFGLWIDQFAAKLGVPDPQPFVIGGTNYAVASAKTGHNPAFSVPPFPPTAVPYTADQVALYLSSFVPSATSLYTFWAGANDINGGGNPVTAADNILANILTLAGKGAKQFLWLDLTDLGSTPLGKASGQSAALTAATNAFNAEWLADIMKLQAQGIMVTGVDVQQLFAQIAANRAAFGFTNITDPAWCGTGGLPTCVSNNPNQFLFWDGEHPTTAADAQIATSALNALAGPTAAIPEPASGALCCLGICAVVAGTRKRRSTVASR